MLRDVVLEFSKRGVHMMGPLKACSARRHFGSVAVRRNRVLRERFPRSLPEIFGTVVALIGRFHKFLTVCKNLSQIFFLTSPKLGAWANPPYPQKIGQKIGVFSTVSSGIFGRKKIRFLI